MSDMSSINWIPPARRGGRLGGGRDWTGVELACSWATSYDLPTPAEPPTPCALRVRAPDTLRLLGRWVRERESARPPAPCRCGRRPGPAADAVYPGCACTGACGWPGTLGIHGPRANSGCGLCARRCRSGRHRTARCTCAKGERCASNGNRCFPIRHSAEGELGTIT